MVGVAAQAVSAARMAIRILRENIFDHQQCETEQVGEWNAITWRERCQNADPSQLVLRASFAWNISTGWVISPETESHPLHERTPMAERPHNFLREGVITGFIGATAIAVWFLIVDTISGRPFYTPIFLGKGVVSVLGKNMIGDTAFTQVLGYTVFHYAAFVIVGIVLTVIVHQAERTPGILAGLLVAFVMMTLGFYMIAAAFSQSALGQLSWAQIFIANLLASSLMLWYLWRKHPKLNHQLKRALEGTDD
jgi:hypothetical protein